MQILYYSNSPEQTIFERQSNHINQIRQLSQNRLFTPRYNINNNTIDLQNYYEYYNTYNTYETKQKLFNNVISYIKNNNPYSITSIFNTIPKNYFTIKELEIFFNYCCIYNNIEFANKFYIDFNIDIHNQGDYPFKLVCDLGYLEFARWIYSFGNTDIYTYNGACFIKSCENGHLDVFKWLCTISNYRLPESFNKLEILMNIVRNKKYKMLDWIYNNTTFYNLNLDENILEEENESNICEM